jgi:hypothetical protein
MGGSFDTRVMALALMTLVGCIDDDSVIEPGVVVSGPHPWIDVPDAATVGIPFTVRIFTYGNGCISVHSTEVEMLGDTPVVTPYDRRRTEGVCIQKLCNFVHEARLSFDSPGKQLILFRGRRSKLDEDVLYEFQAHVIVE